jgi:hypothetical protein
MSDAPSILVLSACTASKISAGSTRAVRAEELYDGQQHRRLMRGVETYRAAAEPSGPLDLKIVSAAHGVIPGHQPLRSYDSSFSGLRPGQVHLLATKLGIPQAISSLLSARRRLAVLLLGDNYLRAAEISDDITLGAPTLVFTSPGPAARLPAVRGLHPIALSNQDARRFSCGLIGLKGELVARILSRLVHRRSTEIPLDREGMLAWLADAPHELRIQRDQMQRDQHEL